MKNKSGLIAGVVVAALAGGWWVSSRNGAADSGEIQYKYEKIEEGELVRSIDATGQLIAETNVDIRSKAGGRVDQILVEEGDIVKKGQLLARIDPSDTRTVVEQAQADVESATARADAAQINLSLEERNRRNGVRDAEAALRIARIRYERAQTNAGSQPALTASSLRSARAALAAQEQALIQLQTVEVPQLRSDAKSGMERAKIELDAAQADFNRQEELFGLGYVSKAQLDRARSAMASSQASYTTAKQRADTIERQLDSRVKQQRSQVEQAESALKIALTNQSRDTVVLKDVAEARGQLEQAQLSLEQAQIALLNIQARAADNRNAKASTVRSRVTLQNAQVQLDSTTVLAPRDGVVTKKYLEAGTIIPPGTSTFSEGTAILQLSDTTKMYVECAVDEADIGAVKVGQNVRIIIEAFPGEQLKGRVSRINPSAETAANITAIKVRVEIDQSSKAAIKPGMNATCEFLTLDIQNALIVPQQAVTREEGKTFVRIKGTDGKPQKVEVKLGESGNDGYQVLSGLSAGQEVVTAEINLAQMREIQQRMQEAQQGGGLAGGGNRQGGPTRTTGGGAAGGGGARGGGGR